MVTKTVNHGFPIPVRAKEQTSCGIGSGGTLQGAAAFAPVDSESALLPKTGGELNLLKMFANDPKRTLLSYTQWTIYHA